MWLEVTNDEKIIYHVDDGEALPTVDIIEGVVIHAEECTDQSSILYTLCTIPNMRVRVELETCVPFNKLTPLIKKYIDSYYNTDTNEHKEKVTNFIDVVKE